MLSLIGKRGSVAASAERIACLPETTPLRIVRLMRIGSFESSWRCLTALGISRPEAPSLRTMKPRSAWMKIANRLSKSFGSTSLRRTAPPRLRPISKRALSFTSALTPTRSPLVPLETSSLDMIDEVPVCLPSSTITTASWVRSRPFGGRAASGDPRWNAKTKSQILTWSSSESLRRSSTRSSFRNVPLRLFMSSA